MSGLTAGMKKFCAKCGENFIKGARVKKKSFCENHLQEKVCKEKGFYFDCGSTIATLRILISPEGAKFNSPGQRPGLASGASMQSPERAE
jgi:hypothetical protein